MAPDELPDPPAGPTEADEEEVLERLYGTPDRDGVFRAQEAR